MCVLDPRPHSAGSVSSCMNLTVFSIVMASNNKKVCAIFGYHVTPFVENQHQ